MSPSLKYAATGVSAVSAVVLGLWPFLDTASRTGLLIAAAVALPVQVVAFALLNRYRGRVNGFLAAWVGGTLVRMLVLGVVAFAVTRSGPDGVMATLLGLVGFFFGLLLLEPVYFRIEPNKKVEA